MAELAEGAQHKANLERQHKLSVEEKTRQEAEKDRLGKLKNSLGQKQREALIAKDAAEQEPFSLEGWPGT